MPAPSSLQLCCSLAELQHTPALAVDLVQQFQSEGADDDWTHIATADNHQLVHILTQHLNTLIAAATPSQPAASPIGCLTPLLVSDLALYSALVNLLFVFASLSSQTVCPILLQYDVANIPLVVGSTADSSGTAVVPLVLLRLQLLALTISSYPDSISPPSPHPLILNQALSLLTHANEDIQLAASACLFLLLSISSLPQSMPALLSHPNLPAFLTAIQSLLTTAPSTGYSSPFLPLSLTVLSEMAACLSLLRQKDESLPVSQSALLEVWDSVCELLEEEEGVAAGGGGEQREGMDSDVRNSALDCLYTLLSIPSMQRDEMLQQYSSYKRKYRNSEEVRTEDEQLPSADATTVTAAEKAEQRSSNKRQSLNPFDNDFVSPADGASSHSTTPSSSLQDAVSFSAADCDAILSSSTSSPFLPTATLVTKIQQLTSLLDSPATQHEWTSYLESTQYRLLLVLAYLYTQESLPLASCDAILSILVSLSCLSSLCQGVTSALLSHPSLLAVLLSQLADAERPGSVLVRLQVLYFVYSSQSSPSIETDAPQPSAASMSSDVIVSRLVPLLSSEDESIVALAVYVMLLSHTPDTSIPAELLSLTSSYSFQLELLQLVNRGAFQLASPSFSSSSTESSVRSSDRSDVPRLLRATLLFLLDLLSSDAGVQWVYTNDLYVLVDVLLQRVEDQQAVSEAEVIAHEADMHETDVVVLCEHVLLALLQHWEGWQVNGGYKRRQVQQLMEQVEREHGADGDTAEVKHVYGLRRQLATQLLRTLSSTAQSTAGPSAT